MRQSPLSPKCAARTRNDAAAPTRDSHPPLASRPMRNMSGTSADLTPTKVFLDDGIGSLFTYYSWRARSNSQWSRLHECKQEHEMNELRPDDRRPSVMARMRALVILVGSAGRCRVAPRWCTTPVRCLVICRSVLCISVSDTCKLPPRSKLPKVAQRFRHSWNRLLAILRGLVGSRPTMRS
jgi:hypothetical protein